MRIIALVIFAGFLFGCADPLDERQMLQGLQGERVVLADMGEEDWRVRELALSEEILGGADVLTEESAVRRFYIVCLWARWVDSVPPEAPLLTNIAP